MVLVVGAAPQSQFVMSALSIAVKVPPYFGFSTAVAVAVGTGVDVVPGVEFGGVFVVVVEGGGVDAGVA